MLLRFIIFFAILIIFPFALILIVAGLGIFYLLVKLGLVNPHFIMQRFAFSGLNKNASNTQSEHQKDHSFTKATLSQFSCKHHNLEQTQDVLMCSDCGKIIQHDNS